jgi:hypothetical protein
VSFGIKHSRRAYTIDTASVTVLGRQASCTPNRDNSTRLTIEYACVKAPGSKTACIKQHSWISTNKSLPSHQTIILPNVSQLVSCLLSVLEAWCSSPRRSVVDVPCTLLLVGPLLFVQEARVAGYWFVGCLMQPCRTAQRLKTSTLPAVDRAESSTHFSRTALFSISSTQLATLLATAQLSSTPPH